MLFCFWNLFKKMNIPVTLADIKILYSWNTIVHFKQLKYTFSEVHYYIEKLIWRSTQYSFFCYSNRKEFSFLFFHSKNRSKKPTYMQLVTVEKLWLLLYKNRETFLPQAEKKTNLFSLINLKLILYQSWNDFFIFGFVVKNFRRFVFGFIWKKPHTCIHFSFEH